MFKIISITITLLFLSLGIFLGVLNPETVKFDLIVRQIEMPLSILLAITLSLGMLLAGIYFSLIIMRKQWLVRKLNKQNLKLSNDIVQLNKHISELEKTSVHPAKEAGVQMLKSD